MCEGLSIKRIIPLPSFLSESSRAMNLHFDTNKPSPPRVAMMNRDASNQGHKATKNSHCKMYAGMLAMAIKTLIFMVDFHQRKCCKTLRN